MKSRDIVIVGIQPWDVEIGSNCKNIALELSRHHRVLYVNEPLNRISSIRDKSKPSVRKRLDVLRGKIPAVQKIKENLWEFYPGTVIEPVNRLKFNELFDVLNRTNSKRFAREINRAVSELGFDNFLLFNDSNMFLGNHLDEFLDNDRMIYYIRDNLVKSPFPYWNTHGARMEKKIIEKADLVVTNSLYYQEYASEFNSESYMVGQGCDVSMFDETRQTILVAPELEHIRKKGLVIGYVGALTNIRLDIELIGEIARHSPEWQLVLVGPMDDAFKASDLHALPNTHFLGSMPPERLPEFIKGFHVCINPQLVNNTTIGNYPRKIDEYLAMGKPVVATRTKAMEYFQDYVYLANGAECYVKAIDRAIVEDSPETKEARRQYALTHSWENSVGEIYKALESATKNSMNGVVATP